MAIDSSVSLKFVDWSFSSSSSSSSLESNSITIKWCLIWVLGLNKEEKENEWIYDQVKDLMGPSKSGMKLFE